MGTKIDAWIERYACMDWAVLYMRLFAGGMMLFHNIGKMQSYDEIIGNYPSFLYIQPTAVFVIVAVAEVLISVLIIMGLWVRMSALVMSLGILAMSAWEEFGIGELRMARNLRVFHRFGRRNLRFRCPPFRFRWRKVNLRNNN